MATPKAHKSIFQARFAPKLKFFELLMPAAQRLDGYANWQTSRVDVTLKDFERHRSVSIQSQALSYDQDEAGLDLERDSTKRLLEELPTALEILSFTRLGLRRFHLRPVGMDFDSLVLVLHTKLFAQDEHLRRIVPPVKDLAYRVDCKQGSDQCRLLVAAVRKDEIPRAIPFNKENHLSPATAEGDLVRIQEAYPDVAIYFDVDFFQAGDFPVGEAQPFLGRADEAISRIVNELDQYLLGTGQEA